MRGSRHTRSCRYKTLVEVFGIEHPCAVAALGRLAFWRDDSAMLYTTNSTALIVGFKREAGHDGYRNRRMRQWLTTRIVPDTSHIVTDKCTFQLHAV